MKKKLTRAVRFMVSLVDATGMMTYEDEDRFPPYLHTTLKRARFIADTAKNTFGRPFGVFEARGFLDDSGDFRLRHLSEKNRMTS